MQDDIVHASLEKRRQVKLAPVESHAELVASLRAIPTDNLPDFVENYIDELADQLEEVHRRRTNLRNFVLDKEFAEDEQMRLYHDRHRTSAASPISPGARR